MDGVLVECWSSAGRVLVWMKVIGKLGDNKCLRNPPPSNRYGRRGFRRIVTMVCYSNVKCSFIRMFYPIIQNFFRIIPYLCNRNHYENNTKNKNAMTLPEGFPSIAYQKITVGALLLIICLYTTAMMPWVSMNQLIHLDRTLMLGLNNDEGRWMDQFWYAYSSFGAWTVAMAVIALTL
jgi:hypothetical protein